MGKMELLKKAGTTKHWIVDQLRISGKLGRIEKDGSGRFIYTNNHLEVVKRYLETRKK